METLIFILIAVALSAPIGFAFWLLSDEEKENKFDPFHW